MLSFLGSEIGRGHPFYLDGLVQALEREGRDDLTRRRADVFSLSRGSAQIAWQAVHLAFRLAARGGPWESLYRRLRRSAGYAEGGRLPDLLGRDLRAWAGREGPVVVDHPLLVAAFGGRADVWYMHGEHAAPPEAIARGAARIFVPTAETAAAFEAGGLARERLLVTGICVEPALAADAEASARRRLARIESDAPLTLACFSSGAEPVRHVRSLVAAAASLAAGPQRVLVFALRGGRLERGLRALPQAARARIERVPFSGRAEIDRVTAAHFDAVDAVVAPPHERSNWALALGTPFFLVGPDVGPFSRLNRALLLEKGVAREIASPEQAAGLAAELERSRAAGELAEMSRRGTGRACDGFAVAARHLAAALDARGD